MTAAPKPEARPDRINLWRYAQMMRRDILSAQPARLYRAWMAEFRTPFFRSYLINQPDLIATVLNERPLDYPKSRRVAAGLVPLLGRRSVFLTNGQEWQRQRRIIDPAFERGRLRDSFPAMAAAVADAAARLEEGVLNVEPFASRLTADIIFRTLFSMPITEPQADEVFTAFREYQETAPVMNLAALVPWLPAFHGRKRWRQALRIRQLIAGLVDARQKAIRAGTAPDDLATRILTARDPETGQGFGRGEMIDQVAIFFLAGHETSAAALGWALYLLATHPEAQERVAGEAKSLPENPALSDLSGLTFIRDCFREALRLYPPVPMMVRQATRAETFRDREVTPGSQIVISPWHLHRHERLWDDPDAFDPDRYATENGRDCLRRAYLPFSSGARVCVGAGFAMAEGVLALAQLTRGHIFAPVQGHVPQPRAHLTVRSANGIRLKVSRRSD